MSYTPRQVLDCDMVGCRNQFASSLSVSNQRSLLKANHRTNREARINGWGFYPIGKNLTAHVCPECRQRLSNTAQFFKVIVARDYREEHTILLDCGHEFLKVEEAPDGTVLCTACLEKWRTSGEVEGLTLEHLRSEKE